MRYKSMLKSALIKSTPNKLFKVTALIKKEPAIMVMSLSKYIKWQLKQGGINSFLFAGLPAFRGIRALHKELEKKYDAFCHNAGLKGALDYADLFRVHLCWEIQKEYYFLATLERWLRKYNIKKLYFENMPLKKTKRYAKDINQLIKEFCAKRNIAFKKI